MVFDWKILRRRAMAVVAALGLALGGLTVTELVGVGGAPESVLAQRSSGGRVGGGSFSRPAPAPAPGGGYGGGGYGYGPGPGFFLFPFFFGGGGGGLFTLLLVAGGAFLLLRALRGRGGGYGGGNALATVDEATLLRLQVALLASARELQRDLNRLAAESDTSTREGLARLAQEASLALLRHPEYWVYANAGQLALPFDQAEAQFNRFSLAERTKYTDETLSRTEGDREAIVKTFRADNPDETAEYIVVTLLVAALGQVSEMGEVRSTEDLRRALTAIGAVGVDQILAVEVIWTPQAETDTLTSEELLTQYSDLVRL